MTNPQSLRYAAIEEMLKRYSGYIDIERNEIGGKFGFIANFFHRFRGRRKFKDISTATKPSIDEAMKELNSLCADFLENQS